MATFTAYRAFDINHIVEMGDVMKIATKTTTKMVAIDAVSNPDVTYTLTGTGFKYDSWGIATGTLTQVQAKLGAAAYFTSANLSYNLNNNYYDGGVLVDGVRIYGLKAEVSQWLKGNDVVNGSSYADVLAGFVGNDKINGNGGNDILQGWSGNDTLNGGVGNDSMYGGVGADTYYVNSTLDKVFEISQPTISGVDLVNSSVSFALGNYIEKLTLTGAAAINGTGNTLANTITGNGAANTLNGGTGTDTLIGRSGNDTYFVDNVGDIVSESSDAGTDLVNASVSYILSANVERLTLTGSSAINGTGNSLDNSITGNSAANIFSGGTGNDTMTGGLGADHFIFNSISVANEDTITDFVVEDGDVISLSSSTFTNSPIEGATLTCVSVAEVFGVNTEILVDTALAIGTGQVDAYGANGGSNVHFVFETDTQHLLYDEDGDWSDGYIQIATITVTGVLTETNFEMLA